MTNIEVLVFLVVVLHCTNQLEFLKKFKIGSVSPTDVLYRILTLSTLGVYLQKAFSSPLYEVTSKYLMLAIVTIVLIVVKAMLDSE